MDLTEVEELAEQELPGHSVRGSHWPGQQSAEFPSGLSSGSCGTSASRGRPTSWPYPS